MEEEMYKRRKERGRYVRKKEKRKVDDDDSSFSSSLYLLTEQVVVLMGGDGGDPCPITPRGRTARLHRLAATNYGDNITVYLSPSTFTTNSAPIPSPIPPSPSSSLPPFPSFPFTVPILVRLAGALKTHTPPFFCLSSAYMGGAEP